MTKTEQVAALLAQRYVCQEVPRGALADIASEVGCSRELVRQVAAGGGYVMPGSGGRVASAPLRLCTECAKPLGRRAKRDYHHACAPTITVRCAQCGTKKDVYLHVVKSRYFGAIARSRAKRGYRASDRWFCDRECQGRFMGKLP